jgi:3-methyladenine DNA glycosylase/8-oxoguanine DNA glycosylase
MAPSLSSDEIIKHLTTADPHLGRMIARVGPYTLTPRRGTLFTGLLKSIVYQQLSGKAAGTIHGRVLALLPPRAEEQPEAILALDDETLRAAGLSRGKLLAIRDLAQRTAAGQLPTRRRLVRMSDEEIIESLVQIRGVGRWTAEMILIFWLGRPDVLPVHDLGVRRGFSIVYGRKELPSPEDLFSHGERWRPHRSAASWYFWRAADLATKKPPETNGNGNGNW